MAPGLWLRVRAGETPEWVSVVGPKHSVLGSGRACRGQTGRWDVGLRDAPLDRGRVAEALW